MFCAITFSMLTTSISIANIPCSDFAQIEQPPPAVVSKHTTTTAIYDISARAVILPNGEKLEAHSGLGPRLDNPEAVKIKAKGPTPPNHYKLTLRERLFHGIRALRLNPVDENKMFGRDGILAHPYMLGRKGESFGCVSLKDYDKFLKQYLSGQVTDLIVVKKIEKEL